MDVWTALKGSGEASTYLRKSRADAGGGGTLCAAEAAVEAVVVIVARLEEVELEWTKM